MAACAVKTGMSAFEREEIVFEVRSGPTGRRMAAFAICGPAVRQVIGRNGLGKISLVTQLALHRGTFELTNGCLEMAAFTRSHGMGGNEMKPRSSMLGDQPCRRPVRLSMTPFAIQTER